MTPDRESTIARCADCHRVYASYLVDGTLNTTTGETCPNCGSRDLYEVAGVEL
jgi:DNA-directed RNA polymerase subunit RPC12/RpoP